jgi:RNA polymerase sigma-70 factor (ECF subfamily)
MAVFQTTRWSLVAGTRSDSGHARRALDELCRLYRPPVLAYLCHHGHAGAEAEDLAQAFFESLLRYRTIARADPERGRFRVFLLTALRRFLAKRNEHDHAAKRGCGIEPLPLDDLSVADGDDGPDQAFERQFALTLIAHSLKRLEGEARKAGKHAMFEALREYLLESPEPNEYEALAQRLQLRRNTLAVAIHRLRTRLREVVQDELSHIVDGEAAFATESRNLCRILRTVPFAPAQAAHEPPQ